MTEREDRNNEWPRGEGFEWVSQIEGGWLICSGIAGVIGLWFFVGTFLPLFLGGVGAGQFGDTFGAMNGLIGGLTLVGAGYAVYAQNEQLKIARREAHENLEERRENQRVQERQAKAEREVSELNAYDALIRHYRSLVPDLPPGSQLMDDPQIRYNQAITSRYLQMTRIILAEIQHTDEAFDWEGTPTGHRTRFRRFQVVLLREARSRYANLIKMPLLPDEVLPLLRGLSSEFRLILDQEGLGMVDRDWTLTTLTHIVRLIGLSMTMEKDQRIASTSDEEYLEQVEGLFRPPIA